MSYVAIERRLASGGVVILDGGTGTELERRGARMDTNAWCGPATIENIDILEGIHRDYIAAGADVLTANTYATSRLILAHAGIGDAFEQINRTAVAAAKRARETSGRDDVAIAGSISHTIPRPNGELYVDRVVTPEFGVMRDSFGELAEFLSEEGCDIILVEMMYHPERMKAAFDAAAATGKPMWAGLAARRGSDGRILSFAKYADIPFEETVKILADYDLAAAGIMHTPSDVVDEALAIVRTVYDGPLMAYPDSGYFKMPHWQFEDIIAPDDLARFAGQWRDGGAQIIGGCCGLGPEHIAAVAGLKRATSG